MTVIAGSRKIIIEIVPGIAGGKQAGKQEDNCRKGPTEDFFGMNF
jgi:hypothetical protein